MRIHLVTLLPVSGGWQLVYPWHDDLPAESQLIDIFQAAHLENPSNINDNVINIRISGLLESEDSTFSPSYITWKNGRVHVCHGCGLFLSDVDKTSCSDECRIRHAHIQ